MKTKTTKTKTTAPPLPKKKPIDALPPRPSEAERERRRKEWKERNDKAAAEKAAFYMPPGELYRSILFRRAKNAMTREAGNYRRIAEETGITPVTIQKAMKGQPMNLSNLWILSRFFGIDWHSLFDLTGKHDDARFDKNPHRPPTKKKI